MEAIKTQEALSTRIKGTSLPKGVVPPVAARCAASHLVRSLPGGRSENLRIPGGPPKARPRRATAHGYATGCCRIHLDHGMP